MYRVLKTSLAVVPLFFLGWLLTGASAHEANQPHWHIAQAHHGKKGHAHLYLNGKKVTRLYATSHFMDKLPKGNLEIRVTLNTNMHEDLSYKAKLVQDVVVFKDFNN